MASYVITAPSVVHADDWAITCLTGDRRECALLQTGDHGAYLSPHDARGLAILLLSYADKAELAYRQNGPGESG